jgi:hypothetical protein
VPLWARVALDVGAPILTLVLAWVSIQQNSRRWFLVALLVAVILTVIQVAIRRTTAAAERRIRAHTSALLDYLVAEIDQASQMEQRMRGDVNAEVRFEHYRDEVEGWRTTTGDELERRLPRSGASQVFLAAVGQTGRGPLFWEYAQLRTCQEALVSIVGSAESFVRRSARLERDRKHSDPRPA